MYKQVSEDGNGALYIEFIAKAQGNEIRVIRLHIDGDGAGSEAGDIRIYILSALGNAYNFLYYQRSLSNKTDFSYGDGTELISLSNGDKLIIEWPNNNSADWAIEMLYA